MSHNINKDIKDLNDLVKNIGSIDKMFKNISGQLINSTDLSNEDTHKLKSVISSMDFDDLAKKNLSDSQLQDLIKSKL